MQRVGSVACPRANWEEVSKDDDARNRRSTSDDQHHQDRLDSARRAGRVGRAQAGRPAPDPKDRFAPQGASPHDRPFASFPAFSPAFGDDPRCRTSGRGIFSTRPSLRAGGQAADHPTAGPNGPHRGTRRSVDKIGELARILSAKKGRPSVSLPTLPKLLVRVYRSLRMARRAMVGADRIAPGGAPQRRLVADVGLDGDPLARRLAVRRHGQALPLLKTTHRSAPPAHSNGDPALSLSRHRCRTGRPEGLGRPFFICR
jgi:hypothetical protein